MTDHDRDPLADVPPDWVKLPDLAIWLGRRWHMDGAPAVKDIITEMRLGRLEYRVAGLSISDLQRRPYGGEVYEPPGLDFRHGQVCVADWDAAAVDWSAGTVNGRFGRDGRRVRHHIELRWMDVERCIRPLLEHREPKRAEEPVASAGSAPAALDVKPANRGGRPPKHDWDRFWMEIAVWTALNGLEEEDRPRLQKHMEDWTAENSKDAQSPATIRSKISQLYAFAAARETACN